MTTIGVAATVLDSRASRLGNEDGWAVSPTCMASIVRSRGSSSTTATAYEMPVACSTVFMPSSPWIPCSRVPGSLLAAGLVVAARREGAAEELVVADDRGRHRLVVPRHEGEVEATVTLAGEDDPLRRVDRGREGDDAAVRVRHGRGLTGL